MLNAGEIGGIAGGCAVVVLGSTAFVTVMIRRRRRLRRTLQDADPAARLAALEAIANRGVYSYLDALIERALVEDDPRVQETLARIVTVAQWDPSSDRRLLQLKGWAERLAASLDTAPEPASPAAQAATGAESAPQPPVEPPSEPESREPEEGEARIPAPPTEEAAGSGRGSQAEVEAWLVPDPWAGKPFDESSNGLTGDPDLVRTGRGGPSGAAKAEQSAIELLQEAGYGVEKLSPLPDTPRPAAEPEEPSLRRALREVLTQRVITASILEEAARRMRAENERLESTLSTEEDKPKPPARRP